MAIRRGLIDPTAEGTLFATHSTPGSGLKRCFIRELLDYIAAERRLKTWNVSAERERERRRETEGSACNCQRRGEISTGKTASFRGDCCVGRSTFRCRALNVAAQCPGKHAIYRRFTALYSHQFKSVIPYFTGNSSKRLSTRRIFSLFGNHYRRSTLDPV